jgi:hypothetical protein
MRPATLKNGPSDLETKFLDLAAGKGGACRKAGRTRIPDSDPIRDSVSLRAANQVDTIGIVVRFES